MAFLERNANRGSVSTGYDIDNSLKIEEDNAEHMTRTYSEAGVKTKGTISFWHKRSEIQSGVKRPVDCTDGSSSNSSGIFIDAHRLCFDFGGSGRHSLRANALMRDSSAWYHLMATWDTSQGTDSNRTKIYINGEQVTDLHEATYPSQNANVQFFTNTGGGSQVNKLFCQATNTSNHPSGYFAEFNYVNNAQLTPSDFGEYDEDSGIWKPKKYTGSYGDTGFYLNFADAADLGDDESINGNDWTEVNISAADQATDTPTNNFCTINPLIPYYGSVSEGATKWLHTSGGSGWESFVATMGAGTSGKWYAEFKVVTSGSADNLIGICPIDDPDLNRGADHFPYYGSDTSLDESVGYYAANGQRYIGGGGAAYGNTWASTNIMSIAVDMDNGKLYFAKDGVWQNSGDPTSGATGTGALDVRGATKPQSLGAGNYTSGENILANYGGYTTITISSAASDANGYGTFEYAPPSGYYALCTQNLAVYG